MTEALETGLKRLHLANTRRIWRELVARAEAETWSYQTFLDTLVQEEIAHRRQTRLQRAVHAAAFPFLRTVDEFDFSLQSSLRLTTMGSLLTPDFVTQGNAVILSGKPGRGKTHLAIAIAYRAIQNGFDALFVTAADLIGELSAASCDGALRPALARYIKPAVLVVDEVGYLTYENDAANVLFHVVNERHSRRRAMVFTTNKAPRTGAPCCTIPTSARPSSTASSSAVGFSSSMGPRCAPGTCPPRISTTVTNRSDLSEFTERTAQIFRTPHL